MVYYIYHVCPFYVQFLACRDLVAMVMHYINEYCIKFHPHLHKLLGCKPAWLPGQCTIISWTWFIPCTVLGNRLYMSFRFHRFPHWTSYRVSQDRKYETLFIRSVSHFLLILLTLHGDAGPLHCHKSVGGKPPLHHKIHFSHVSKFPVLLNRWLEVLFEFKAFYP